MRFVWLLILISADQISKYYWFEKSGSVLNQGGVFGLLPSTGWVIVLIMIWLVILREWLKHKKGLLFWLLAFVVAGGLSNIIDRLWFGGVRDFIYYPWFNLYGNLADIYLVSGAILSIIPMMKSRSQA